MSRNPSQYGRHIVRLSARIFGEPVPEAHDRYRKIVKLMSEEPYYKKKEFVNYYPPIYAINTLFKKLRAAGLFVDEHLDFNEEMDRQRALRGKGKKRNRDE